MFFDRLAVEFGVSPHLLDVARTAQRDIRPYWEMADARKNTTTLNVLKAFQSSRVSDHNLHGSTGYGYADTGRQACEDVYAAYFGTEAALVRPQIASGTHALSCCLFGILRPGDQIVSIAGKPYDTMEKVIGIKPGAAGALSEFGVTYAQAELDDNGHPDYDAIANTISARTKMVLLQRSRGYDTRPSISVKEIGRLVSHIKSIRSDIVFFVDNCYGEFVEESEPTHVGVDIMAGSLIKNPGGGIVPTGGYIVGRQDLIEAAASRLTAPGVGMAIGATLDMPRTILQGFHFAPSVVCEALKGAIFTSRFFELLGFSTSPRYDQERTDIVQSIEFGRPDLLISFCQGIQTASPVDSFVVPEPWDMPGYTDEVIMAGGTFVSGSSIEMSADGAMRLPYAAYFQGGISSSQVIIACMLAAHRMCKAGLMT